MPLTTIAAIRDEIENSQTSKETDTNVDKLVEKIIDSQKCSRIGKINIFKIIGII